jgi:serine protease Do
MKLPRKPIATLVLAGACVGAGYAGFDLFQDAQFARAEQRVEATREQLASTNDLASVFKSVNKVMEPSVVSIEVKKTVRGVSGVPLIPRELRRFFDRDGDGQPDFGPDGDQDGPPMIQRGTGSGVIIEADGDTAYIVTNNHVAGEAQEMEITLFDGRVIHNGKLLGADPKSDLALIKVTAERVMPAKWGDSSTLAKGDWVLAFGSPLGYVGSMTHGIVSALDRQSNPEGGVGVLGRGGYENFIQVDCPINPGNSGGPLVNVAGEVIGINTAIASRTGGFQGIGFAIPANQAKPIIEQLKKNGKVTRGWLGVEITDVAREPENARRIGYAGDKGVLVRGSLRGTPAYGKLQPGDVVTSINGKSLKNTQELRNQIAVTPPGTEVKLGVSRRGKEIEVPVTIGEQPDEVTLATGEGEGGPAGDAAAAPSVDSLGLKLSDDTDERTLRRYGLADAGDGVLVTAVAAGSPAALAGLRAGDLIKRVNESEVTDVAAIETALSKAPADEDISLLVANRTGERLVFIPVEALKRDRARDNNER